MKLILTIMAALLLGSIAYGQTWSATDAAGAPSVTSIDSGGRRVAFYVVSGASTTDSDVLGVGGCRVVTLEMFETASSAAEGYFMSSSGATKTYTRKLLSDVDGGGVDDVTQNGTAGRDAIYDTGPVEYVFIDSTVAPDPNDPAQTVAWKVTCGE